MEAKQNISIFQFLYRCLFCAVCFSTSAMAGWLCMRRMDLYLFDLSPPSGRNWPAGWVELSAWQPCGVTSGGNKPINFHVKHWLIYGLVTVEAKGQNY